MPIEVKSLLKESMAADLGHWPPTKTFKIVASSIGYLIQFSRQSLY